MMLYLFSHQHTALRMLAYFVVFHKKGFSPNDLRKAQKSGGKLQLTQFVMPLTHPILGYFKKDSPDFINYKGQSLAGPQQVEAFAQAQSIGKCNRHN
jgi:sodium/potassium-transporting ATPase subunit alpha